MNRNPLAESNSAGFGENETSRIPLCAVPASSLPGLSPSRGSLPAGYVCAWSAETESDSASMATSACIVRAVPIRRSSSCVPGGRAGKDSRVRPLDQHLLHDADFGGLYGLDVISKH